MQPGREQFPVRPVERKSLRPVLALAYLGFAAIIANIAIVLLTRGDDGAWGALVIALTSATLAVRSLWIARRRPRNAN